MKYLVGYALAFCSMLSSGNAQDVVKEAKAEVSLVETVSTSAQRVSLEKFVADIEAEHVLFVELLKTKESTLEKLRAELRLFQETLGSAPNANLLGEQYRTVTVLWAQAADNILELFRNVKIESAIDKPEFVSQTSFEDADNFTFDGYSKTYLQAAERQTELSQLRASMLDKLKVRSFKILNDSGELRAQLLQQCEVIECSRSRGLNRENLVNLLREVKIVPLKFVAAVLSQWIEIKGKLGQGLDGWISLAKQSLLLLLLLLIPIILIKLLNWTSNRLEVLKRSILARSMMDYRRRTNLAIWISRLNPFIPSIGMILSVQLARILIASTDLNRIADILFYIQIYFVYRLARRLLVVVFEIVFTSDSVDALKSLKSRIEKSATAIAKLIFIEYVLLHITQDAVRKALAYELFSSIIFWLNWLFVFYQASLWKIEITDAFQQRFPKLSKRTPSRSRLIALLILPLQFIAIIIHDLYLSLVSHLVRIDFVKRILSEVLRKRLEGVEKSAINSPPPKDYLKEFDYYLAAHPEIFVERESSPIHSTIASIGEWLSGQPADDLIILVGNRGMGKTTSLTHIHASLNDKCRALLLTVPPKILSEESLCLWLSDSLSTSIQSLNDMTVFDQSLNEKIVVCIDDIQNLFIGSIGGFAAYRLFLGFISLKTKNIFWCLTINSRSWAYLNGIFGPEHFYGKALSFMPWRDFEIQNLILARHRQTKFSRSFDDSIKAYGAGDTLGQQAEAQFFRLLWGQSRGNPRSALMYWISAINSPKPDVVHVGIPSFINSNAVGEMSDDALFILSSIARHESLSSQELKLVTGIDETIIRKCLNEAKGKELIWIDEKGRARISSRAQYVIDYFLIGKNFLYE